MHLVKVSNLFLIHNCPQIESWTKKMYHSRKNLRNLCNLRRKEFGARFLTQRP